MELRFLSEKGVIKIRWLAAASLLVLTSGCETLGEKPIGRQEPFIEIDEARLANREASQPAQPQFLVTKVFFATDRNVSKRPEEAFGNGRGSLKYGYCEVSIPRDHRMGNLEAPSMLRLEFRKNPSSTSFCWERRYR